MTPPDDLVMYSRGRPVSIPRATSGRSLRLELDAPARSDALAADEPSERFRFYTDLELGELPPQVPAIDGVLYRDTLAGIVAKWESFKTFIALEMGFCIALNADWYGRPVAYGAVIYISAEGGRGLAKRVKALRATYGNITQQIPMILHPGAVQIDNAADVAAAVGAAQARLRELGYGDLDVIAVFIDTVSRNMKGDENKAIDMNAFIAGCDLIRQRTGACVVAIHHAGWSEERSRGSTTLPASLDTEMFLTRDGDTVAIKCTKMKDGPHFPEVRLEVFPIAGSLAFRALVPTSPKLTANERVALIEVQDAPGRRSNDWRDASGLAKGSYDNARKRLIALAYVKRCGDLYVATDAGRSALGTKDSGGTSEVQQGESW